MSTSLSGRARLLSRRVGPEESGRPREAPNSKGLTLSTACASGPMVGEPWPQGPKQNAACKIRTCQACPHGTVEAFSSQPFCDSKKGTGGAAFDVARLCCLSWSSQSPEHPQRASLGPRRIVGTLQEDTETRTTLTRVPIFP